MIIDLMIIAIIVIIVLTTIACCIELLYWENTTEETTEKESIKPIEKRYIYTILGRETPHNSITFRYIKSDTKLTYQQIKDKFQSIEVMSINVLDTKTGKF